MGVTAVHVPAGSTGDHPAFRLEILRTLRLAEASASRPVSLELHSEQSELALSELLEAGLVKENGDGRYFLPGPPTDDSSGYRGGLLLIILAAAAIAGWAAVTFAN